MLYSLYLIGGITLIIFSANWLVDGASALAKKMGISDIVIGLTIVAFGTSAPELTVNIFSAFKGATDIAIGNILGSNICNIFLILGASAIVFPIDIPHNTKWKEIPFSLLAVIVLSIIANDVFIDGSSNGNFISRTDGLVLLCFMIIFLVYTFEMGRHNSETFQNNRNILTEDVKISSKTAILFIFVGLAGLYFGGKYLVTGAVEIARTLGMSEKVIGLTIIAVGTSFPELATSIVAAFKKNTDIAIGNVVGSNIYNVFFVLGTTSVIKPIPFNSSINLDIFVAAIASILLFLASITFNLKKVGRIEGIIFVVIYICYITYSIVR